MKKLLVLMCICIGGCMSTMESIRQERADEAAEIVRRICAEYQKVMATKAKLDRRYSLIKAGLARDGQDLRDLEKEHFMNAGQFSFEMGRYFQLTGGLFDAAKYCGGE